MPAPPNGNGSGRSYTGMHTTLSNGSSPTTASPSAPSTSESNDHYFTLELNGYNLKEIEQKVINHALSETDGNRKHAAKLLGINVRTLRRKLNGR